MSRRNTTLVVALVAVVILGCVLALTRIAAVTLLLGNKQGAVYSTVSKVVRDSSLVGKRVKVAGAVVDGSWDKTSNPMVFVIRDETDNGGSGPTIKVIYTGASPSTFGDGVVAIVTGVLKDGRTIEATELITKQPAN